MESNSFDLRMMQREGWVGKGWHAAATTNKVPLLFA